MTIHYNKTSEKEKRRELRNNSTDAEKKLWQHLKGKQLAGFKFRRQHSIDSYVLDFYCPEVKLAVEIDGPTHFSDDAVEYDQKRNAHISSYGITTIRFLNTDVYKNIDGVLEMIRVKLNELRQPPPNPLLGKEGEMASSGPLTKETKGGASA